MRSSSITLFAIMAFTSSVFAVPAGPVAPQPSAVQVNTNAGVNVGWCTYRREGVTTQYCTFRTGMYGCSKGSCDGQDGKPCSGGDGYYVCPGA
ncbi:uncharacterized protein L3040_005000 [Drepanopeziza brunnea f. sp. 'multigermtubi']|uniref:uncharacterized protein n=1 Tax=Drepanopeziza brunnea f. sp. 'multigermtubi' TaxID=698441 RepID=UPI00239B0568|nr:hypothetical protein L3040_005000 [Drepanopeziza brunnea f. sp. 'multigermtubi']